MTNRLNNDMILDMHNAPDYRRYNQLPARAGMGLKAQHFDGILQAAKNNLPRPAWLEVHPQNYYSDGGAHHRWLTAIAAYYPLSFHSVGLSLGSGDGLAEDELEQLAQLVERYQPASISDHISWSGNAHEKLPDLLPLPYREDMLAHFAAQVMRVQDRLKRPILVENPSRYLSFANDEMEETDFINQLCRKTGCGLLLDINNIEVSLTNLSGHNQQGQVELLAKKWLDGIDISVIGQVHMAGHKREDHDSGAMLIDDHSGVANEMSMRLYAYLLQKTGALPVMIEWDKNIPQLDVVIQEQQRLDRVLTGMM